MEQNNQVSKIEAVSVMVNLLCCKLFLLTPVFFIQNAKSAAPLTILFIFSAALFFFFIFQKKMHNRLFSQISSPILKHLFHFISLFLVFFCCTVNFSLLIYFFKLLAFPRSPYLFLALPFAAAMIACAKGGIKSICKTNGFFVPLIFGLLVIMLLLQYPNFSFINLFPLLGENILSTLLSFVFMLSSLSEILILFYLSAYCKTTIYAIAKPSLFISCLIYLIVIGTTLLMGNFKFTPAVFSITQNGFFGRNDGIFLLLCALSGMLYLSTLLYFTVDIFRKTFGTDKDAPLLIPFTLLIVTFSEITFLNPEGQNFLKQAGIFLWLFPFIAPLLLMLLPKKKKEDVPRA